MARREKQPVHHVQMTDGKRAIIQGLLQEYDSKRVIMGRQPRIKIPRPGSAS